MIDLDIPIQPVNLSSMSTYPITHPLPGQIKPLPFTVDGQVAPGDDQDLAGDGQFAPFYVFDQNNQRNIAGPFESRERAESERLHLSAKHGVPLEWPI